MGISLNRIILAAVLGFNLTLIITVFGLGTGKLLQAIASAVAVLLMCVSFYLHGKSVGEKTRVQSYRDGLMYGLKLRRDMEEIKGRFTDANPL